MDSSNVVSMKMEDGSFMNFPQLYIRPEDVPSCSSHPPPPPLPLPPPPISAENPPAALHAPPPSAAAEPPATEAARFPENKMYKTRLQEFAQKANIDPPMYHTVNEIVLKAPRFRSTVWVGGKSFTTEVNFAQRKAAEQEVARVALERLPKIIRDEECSLVYENKESSKLILNEYAAKMKVEKPTYNTVKLEGVDPLFASSLVFNGTKYTGDAARNKKEAERLAAHSAILSILDNSSSATLFGVIKSKSRIYADEVKPNNSESVDASNVSAIENTVVEATMVPNVPLQQCSEQPIGDGSGSKKRRKNKNKANKKARQESLLPVAAFPLNEIPRE